VRSEKMWTTPRGCFQPKKKRRGAPQAKRGVQAVEGGVKKGTTRGEIMFGLGKKNTLNDVEGKKGGGRSKRCAGPWLSEIKGKRLSRPKKKSGRGGRGVKEHQTVPRGRQRQPWGRGGGGGRGVEGGICPGCKKPWAAPWEIRNEENKKGEVCWRWQKEGGFEGNQGEATDCWALGGGEPDQALSQRERQGIMGRLCMGQNELALKKRGVKKGTQAVTKWGGRGSKGAKRKWGALQKIGGYCQDLGNPGRKGG